MERNNAKLLLQDTSLSAIFDASDVTWPYMFLEFVILWSCMQHKIPTAVKFKIIIIICDDFRTNSLYSLKS